MDNFFKSVRFKILAAIVALMAGFMVMSLYRGGTASFFTQAVSVVTVSAQRLASSMVDGVTGFLDKYLNAGETYEENKRLQSELNALRERLVDYDKIKHENDQFREIIGVKEKRADIRFETASVIARSPNDRFFSFTIDRGSLDGVKYLDPVMTADGLVGYVSEVTLTTAKVLTILDVSVNVGAYSSATRDIGVVTGTVELAMQGLCLIEYLPRDTKITRGNLVLTSGGSLFPKDLMIGVVEEVRSGSAGISMVAVIRPAASVRTVKDVFVITSFEGQGGEVSP